ncbi:MAG: hypothetical protein M5U29_02610 [Anaerolineae bacterium]|nr:hypothetical protein [Anaerolineae bacterium]
MNTSMVPYEHGILIPSDWHAAGLVTCPSGALTGYTGPAALVLAKTALHLCGPGGIVRTVLYDHVREVAICDMVGIVIEHETAYGTVLSSPREAYGVDITYEVPGGMRLHLRVLVRFYNQAAEWVAEIEDVVDTFYRRMLGSQAIVKKPSLNK